MSENKIKSFQDLEVYTASYAAMLVVHQQLLPQLPNSQKFDLKDQLSRSSKAVPRLIAEGYAKRHQKSGFAKYLDDAMAEANETIVSIEQCRDLYSANIELCNKLVADYDKIARQLYRLREAWHNFHSQPKPQPILAS